MRRFRICIQTCLTIAMTTMLLANGAFAQQYPSQNQPGAESQTYPPTRDNGAIARIMRSEQWEQLEPMRKQDAAPRQRLQRASQASFNSKFSTSSSEPTADLRLRRGDAVASKSVAATKETRQLNFVERESQSRKEQKASGKSSSFHNTGQLVSRIGMNLAFVLSMGIGGVLLAKQWMKPAGKKKLKVAAPESEDAMEVQEILKLDSKSTLQLIRCGSTQILVATDGLGIKSVNVLNQSFDAALLEQSLMQESDAESDFSAGNYAQSEHPSPTPDPNSPQAQFRALLNRQKRTDSGHGKSGRPHVAATAYRSAEKTTGGGDDADSDSDGGIDERLIKMFLENSKKRAAAKTT